jgi:Flp pilus assembly protein TadD
MSRNWKRTRVKGMAPDEEARREEQGDLLADAVSGAFRSEEPFPGGEERVGESGSPEEATGTEWIPAGGEDATREGGAEAGEGSEVVLPPEDLGPVEAEAAGDGVPEVAEEAPPLEMVMEDAVPEPAPGADPEPAAEVEPRPEPIPLSPWEQKMAWAKERAREGRLGEAEELYRELLQENPDSVRARNNLGIILDEKGDHQGAVAELQVARQLEPRNGEVLGNLGAALGAMGRYVEAEDALRAAHRLDPSNLEIRANLGILFFRKGLYEQAEAELAAVCVKDPGNGAALFYRGEALNRLGRVEEAIEVLSRSVELFPGNPRAYHTLGVLFDKKRLPERAAPMYRKARELTRT